MNKLIAAAAPLIAFASLSACGETGEDAEIDMTTQASEIMVDENALGPPDETMFAAAYAKACPEIEPVTSSICQANGMGGESFTCDYGLGDPETRGLEATLVKGDDEWVIDSPVTACAADEE